MRFKSNRVSGLSIFTLTVIIAGIFNHSFAQTQESQTYISNPTWGKWQDRQEPIIEFTTVQTFGSEDQSLDEILPGGARGIRGLFEDKEENIYFLNYETNRLLSFDKKGNLRWATGQEGQGPGDFSNPRSMTWDGKQYLYVFNRGTLRIDRYDLQGNYLRSLFLPKEAQFVPVQLDYIPPSGLFGAGAIGGEYGLNAGIFRLEGDDLTYASNFIIKTEPVLEIPVGYYYAPPYRKIDQQIFVGHKRKYAFDIYSSSGKFIKRVDRDYDVIVEPGIVLDQKMGNAGYSGIFVDAFGGAFPPVKLSDQYFLQPTRWSTNVDDPEAYAKSVMDRKPPTPITYKNSLDLLDSEFNLLYSLETNGQFHSKLGKILATGQDYHLYTYTAEPYPQIKKVKVIINE